MFHQTFGGTCTITPNECLSPVKYKQLPGVETVTLCTKGSTYHPLARLKRVIHNAAQGGISSRSIKLQLPALPRAVGGPAQIQGGVTYIQCGYSVCWSFLPFKTLIHNVPLPLSPPPPATWYEGRTGQSGELLLAGPRP